MRKEVTLALAVVLIAQVFAASSLFAQTDIALRIRMFARAAVAEAMRGATGGSVAPGNSKIDELEIAIVKAENQVQLFKEVGKDNRREAIQDFRNRLIEKCCKLSGKTR